MAQPACLLSTLIVGRPHLSHTAAPQTWSNAKLQATIIGECSSWAMLLLLGPRVQDVGTFTVPFTPLLVAGSSTNDGQLRCVFILPAGEHAKVGLLGRGRQRGWWHASLPLQASFATR